MEDLDRLKGMFLDLSPQLVELVCRENKEDHRRATEELAALAKNPSLAAQRLKGGQQQAVRERYIAGHCGRT
jgi:hypothetical protein